MPTQEVSRRVTVSAAVIGVLVLSTFYVSLCVHFRPTFRRAEHTPVPAGPDPSKAEVNRPLAVHGERPHPHADLSLETSLPSST